MPHYRMYIDDTGNVGNEATNDPRRRFASITGVIFEKGYYTGDFEPLFNKMKERHFGLTRKGRPPILHRHNVITKEGIFSCLKEPEKEKIWNENCLKMYRNAEYVVITTSVVKIAFYYKYPKWNEDIYYLLFSAAVERYFFFLQSRSSTGDVLAEARGKTDLALKERFRKTLDEGTGFISSSDLSKRFSSKEIKIKPESDDIAGLQMADMLAATSFSHCRKIYAGGRGPEGFSKSVADILENSKYHRDPKRGLCGVGRVWRPS